MNNFAHICALMIAPVSATTDATQAYPLVQPQMYPVVHLYGDFKVHP